MFITHSWRLHITPYALLAFAVGMLGCDKDTNKLKDCKTSMRPPDTAASANGQLREAYVVDHIQKPAIRELLHITRLPGQAQVVAFSPDGRTYAVGFRHSRPRLFDTATGNFKQAIPGNIYHIDALTFSPDGHLLAFRCRNNPAPNNLEGEIRTWNLRTSRTDLIIKDSGNLPTALAFSLDGKLLVSGDDSTPLGAAGFDGHVKIWDAANGNLLTSYQDRSMENISLTFSPDGKKMAVGGQKGEIALWDVAARKTTDYLDFLPLAVCFTPDAKTVLASDEGIIKSWDLATKKVTETRLQDGPSGREQQVFSRDGHWLAGGVKLNDTGEKLIVFVWDVASGKRVAAWGHEGFREIGGEEVCALAFSPDGTRLLAVSSITELAPDGLKSRSEIRLWDMTKLPKCQKD